MRSEPNPSGIRDYSGVETPASGFSASLIAAANRTYEIEIGVRATARAEPVFSVGVGAVASMRATLPSFAVHIDYH